MYIQRVIFKRTKDSEWEKGLYVGETYNSEKGVFLDVNYNPLPKETNGCSVWDYQADLEQCFELRY